MTPGRGRLALFVAACALAVAAPALAVLDSRRNDLRPDRPAGIEAAQALAGAPHILFRDLRPEAGGRLSVASLEAPASARAVTGLECLRAYMAAGQGLCLDDHGGMFSPYRAVLFDESFTATGHEPVGGIISRARVSPDGRYGAATVFVTGDDYAPGSFSTRTTLFDLERGYALTDLEEFATYRDGQRVSAPDFNFWGVTFDPTVPGGGFYATLATAGETYLVKGDMARLRLDIVREGVECPSMSPDGTRLAFKLRTNPGATVPRWRPAVLDLATLEARLLTEGRNVDDQVEWLDDHTVLYAVDDGRGPPDIWSAPADGTGRPRLFLADADSPSVSRAPGAPA